MGDYITPADTNKLIRKALAEFWPKVDFSVRLQSGGNSARITWVDGPTEEEIRLVTDRFRGADFDGMEDLESSVYGIHPETLKEVHFGTKYVFTERMTSVGFLKEVAQKVCDRYGLPLPEIQKHNYDKGANVVEDWSLCPGGGSETLAHMIWQEAHRTAAGKPAPVDDDSDTPKSNKGYRAVKVAGGWEIHETDFEDVETFRQYKDTLGFRWNKTNPKDKFWFCPVETLPPDVQALVDKAGFDEVVENLTALQAAPSNTPAQKFRAMAETLEKQIDEKRNPATAQQNPTRRRNSIIESMAQDADNLERIQTVLKKMADAWDDGSISDSLKGVRSRALIEYLLKYDSMPHPFREKQAFKRIIGAGLARKDDFYKARYALRELVKDEQPKVLTPEQKIAAIKRDLVGSKIEGFIPTPDDIVDMMVGTADIRYGMRVLEPSAGWGNIADGVRKAHPEVTLHCVEPVLKLRDILELKGHTLVEHNIFMYDVMLDEMYDRILMNPPFEDEQDIEHVRYVYEQHLKDGGRIVAIMSEHGFFAKTKQAREFREWLEPIGTSEPLPDDAFVKNGYRSTGVRTRLVVIDKPVYVPAPKKIDPLVKARQDYQHAAQNGTVEEMKAAARALREALENKKKESENA